jgi:RNA polymerase II elongation factor ELL
MERKREQRFTLVHELAVMDRTADYLKKKWTGKEEDFRPTLEKMADPNPDSKKWTMKKPCWKELDVWKYSYDSQDDRQSAIDNAIRQYDKQRLSSSEIEWQRLLPKDERGKGKCLSRLQANLAKGPAQPAPKIKVQKAEDSSGSKDDTDVADNTKPKVGGESMSRANSSSLPAKPKKPSAQEAQAKRLLNNSKPKATVPKTSPSKTKPASKNDRRVLSAAIIENSDSSGDEAPMLKSKQAQPKAKDTVIVNTRPSAPAREPVKKPPVKRPREESDSSSSSGTPLSKRIKPKQPLPAPSARPHATKPSSQQSQARAAASSVRNKSTNNTSPTKSSPLASSPPTNASDLDEDAPTISKKRKFDKEDKPMPVKRRVQSVPSDVMSKAHKFKAYYQQYETLHYEISALDNPPHEKLADLLDMRDRLQNMKREIYKQYSPDRD